MILILMRIWIVASALSIGGISAAATEPIDETKIKTHRTRRLRRSSHVLNLDSVEQSKITGEQEAAIENINRIIGRSNDDEKPKRSNRDENRQLLHAGLISTMNVKLVDRQEEFLSNSKRTQVVQDEDLVWLMAHVSERRFQSSMPDKPTQRPVREPTRTPTPKPSRAPTYRPTIAPVPQTRPTTVPSGDPNPNTGPTPSRPTDAPVAGPAPRPTLRPTQPKPTLSPNADPNPGPAPVRQPTRNPTRSPTGPPVDEPTRPPTNRPTYQPTNQPTNQPIDRSTSPPTNGSPIYQDVSNAPTNPPVAAPDGSGPNPVPPSSVGETVCGGLTLEERQTLILGQLSTYSGREITITGTPQNLAYRWLIDEDAVQVCPEDFLNVQQRYILAVLYYATNGDRWFKCNALSAANPSQCLGGDSQRFLSSSDVCFWYGISCNRMRVSGISIDENNLRGELPDELGYMEQIEDLDFDGELEEGLNYLIGSIPTTLGLLEKLVTLDLDSNELTGTIPDEIFDADRLTIMDLDSNELTGTLNSKFMTLAELQILFLDNNGFFGTLPPEMGEMERLRFLRLDRNELSGSIPGAWEAMGKLRVLFLNNNGGITGTLPEYLGDFTDMQQLSLFDTGISGTVPSSLGELTGLVNLFLHFTDLTGTMPQEICDLRTSGALNFLTADCAGNNPKLRCSQPDCCTVCF